LTLKPAKAATEAPNTFAQPEAIEVVLLVLDTSQKILKLAERAETDLLPTLVPEVALLRGPLAMAPPITILKPAFLEIAVLTDV